MIPAALLAGSALGQTQVPAPTAAAPAVPDPNTKQVEGVTVTGQRPLTKPCSPRDQACIATVIAELKAHYPKELQKWCAHVEERAAMNNLMFADSRNVLPYMPPEVTRSACTWDKKR